MTMISDLSRDLVEEIIFRVPRKALKAMRSTCRQWNALYKDPSFTKKHWRKTVNETMVMTMYDFRVGLVSVSFHNHELDGLADPLSIIKQIGKLNIPLDISKVFLCDGLLLCVTKEDLTRLLVWNPYLGQTICIKPRNSIDSFDILDIGYDGNNNHTILWFSDHYDHDITKQRTVPYEIYDLKSKSWRILYVSPDWFILDYRQGLSVKGNTYFLAQEKLQVKKQDMGDFLLCFDFTREIFGPYLPLLFHSVIGDSVILSTVREEQLAVLLQRGYTCEMEIWITTKIEPSEVSWSSLFRVDITNRFEFLNGSFDFLYASYFVDEKKKVAVLCDKDSEKRTNYKAYMVREGGYYGEEDLGQSKCLPLVYLYVPSSVQIQKGIHATTCKRKERDY